MVRVAGTGSVIENCEFWYGGYTYWSGAYRYYMLWVTGTSPPVSVLNCAFRYAPSYGSGLFYEYSGGFVVTPVIVSNCGNGITISGNQQLQPLVATNTFEAVTYPLADARQENRLAEHLVDLVQVHAYTFENLHCLAAQKAVLYAVDLGKSTLTQEALDLVGVAYDLSF